MRTIATTVFVVIAALTGTPSAEAHCTWRHPGHCLKGAATIIVEKPVEIIIEAGRDIGEEAERFGEDVKDEAERVGRKTGLDNVDDLGAKLAAVGTAVGAVVAGTACTAATLGGCAPIAVGGIVGSGVGSLLAGEPSGYVGVHVPTGSDPDDEDGERDTADEHRVPSKSAPASSQTTSNDLDDDADTEWGPFEGQDLPRLTVDRKPALDGLCCIDEYGEIRDEWVLQQGAEEMLDVAADAATSTAESLQPAIDATGRVIESTVAGAVEGAVKGAVRGGIVGGPAGAATGAQTGAVHGAIEGLAEGIVDEVFPASVAPPSPDDHGPDAER